MHDKCELLLIFLFYFFNREFISDVLYRLLSCECMKVFAIGVHKIRAAFHQYQSVGNSWAGDLRRQLSTASGFRFP